MDFSKYMEYRKRQEGFTGPEAREEVKDFTFEQARHYVGSFNLDTEWEPVGKFQLDLLKENGCVPTSKVLEIGCGCLVAGHHVIPYLDPWNYVGIEPNKWLIDVVVKEKNLQNMISEKLPLFIHREDFDASGVGPHATFDFIFGYSILSHIGQKQFHEFFTNLSKVSTKDTVFLFSIFFGEKNSGQEWWTYPGVTVYTHEFLKNITEQYGFTYTYVPEYEQRLLNILKRGTQPWIILKKVV